VQHLHRGDRREEREADAGLEAREGDGGSRGRARREGARPKAQHEEVGEQQHMAADRKPDPEAKVRDDDEQRDARAEHDGPLREQADLERRVEHVREQHPEHRERGEHVPGRRDLFDLARADDHLDRSLGREPRRARRHDRDDHHAARDQPVDFAVLLLRSGRPDPAARAHS